MKGLNITILLLIATSIAFGQVDTNSDSCDSIININDSLRSQNLVAGAFVVYGIKKAKEKRAYKKLRKSGLISNGLIDLESLCQELKQLKLANKTDLQKIVIEYYRIGPTISYENGVKLNTSSVLLSFVFDR